MRLKYFFIIFVVQVFFVLSSCSLSKEELKQALTQQLQENAQEHGIPAQALVVMHNLEILYRNSVGISDLETKKAVSEQSVFPVFSVSKLFASTLTFQLVESGQLDLTAPASNYLSFLPPSWRNIRVEQFLNHTSGVPEYYTYQNEQYDFPPTMEEAFKRLHNKPLLFKPDSEVRYNQTNYLVIKALLEAITHTPYRALVETNIIVPLALTNSWFGLQEVPKTHLVSAYLADNDDGYQQIKTSFPEYSISHSDVYTSVDDLSRFLSSLAQGKLVSQKLLMELWQPYVLSNGDQAYFAAGWDYGSSGGWRELGHDGGTLVRVRVLFQNDLSNHFIIVYLTNGNNDGVWSRTLVDSIQDYVL